MLFNRKLKDENIRLQCRIKELEERLCPCEQHDWVLISTTYNYDGYGYGDAKHYYKCRQCGKELRD